MGSYPQKSSQAKIAPISFLALTALVALCILPALSILYLPKTVNLGYISVYALLISAITFYLYRHDKRQAQAGGWRTPESTLHLLDLAGGWPGAYLAQRRFRHKTVKLSFQAVFWLTIAVYQYVALDYLCDWRLAKVVLTLGK